jgi:hypothetical protein
MAEITNQEMSAPAEVEQLQRGDWFYQILCGVGIASGLMLLWTMETVRNLVFRGLNALHIPPRRHRRGSAFPAGQPRPRN